MRIRSPPSIWLAWAPFVICGGSSVCARTDRGSRCALPTTVSGANKGENQHAQDNYSDGHGRRPHCPSSFGGLGDDTTNPSDPNDVEEIDNPVDENDDSGFDDWGLLGLLGLVGLAGLAGRKRNDVRTYDDRPTTTR